MKTEYQYFEKQYYNLYLKGLNSWQDDLTWKNNRNSFIELIEKSYFPKSGNLIELGCGDGRNTLFFANRGYNSYGIDISMTALELADKKATENGLKAEFINDNVISMKKIASNFFDVVIDGSCFHCILNDDRKLFLQSVFRILKNGGFCQFRSICGEMTDEEIIQYYDIETQNVINLDDDNFQYFHQGFANDIINEVKKAGFKVLNTQILDREPVGDCDFIIIDAVKD
ncbi:MAG: class I SAM-dependent methyltransferase [archaeon]